MSMKYFTKTIRPFSLSTSLLIIIAITLTATAKTETHDSQQLIFATDLFTPPQHITTNDMQEDTGNTVNIYFSSGRAYYKQSDFDNYSDFCQLKVKLSPNKNLSHGSVIPKGFSLNISDVATKTATQIRSPYTDTIIIFEKKLTTHNDSTVEWLWCHIPHLSSDDVDDKEFNLKDLKAITGPYLNIPQ